MVKLLLDNIFRALGYIPAPRFPQAGLGSGIIFYRVAGPHRVNVLVSSRSSTVGKGSGISCGGWLDLAGLVLMPDGTIESVEDSALREAGEEIPGVFGVIAREVLAANLSYLAGWAVYKPHDPYGNRVHGVTLLVCPVTEAEETALCALPISDETAAPLRAVTLAWTGDAPRTEEIDGIPDDFYHPHDREAFATLVQRLARADLPLVRKPA